MVETRSPRWEDLEDREYRCPRCLHWWVSHGVPTDDDYGCTVIESSASERWEMSQLVRELERQACRRKWPDRRHTANFATVAARSP